MKDVAKMSASINTPSRNNSSLSHPDGDRKKWIYALLGFGILGLLSLLFLFMNLSKVTGYVGSVNQLEVSSSNLARHVNEAVFVSDEQHQNQAKQLLAKDLESYQTLLKEAQTYSLADEQLYQSLTAQWNAIEPDVQLIINTQADPQPNEGSNEETVEPLPDLQQKAIAISDFVAQTQDRLQQVDRDIISRTGIIFPALLFLLSLMGAAYALYRQYQTANVTQRLLIEKEKIRQRDEMDAQFKRARAVEEENQKNQQAILRLLDELEDLADGDLTTNATVTEDITGAIADSVNYAIDQLRQLVQAINSTAVSVAQSSEKTQLTATELAEASEQQSKKIVDVSSSINQMVNSIEQVSLSAYESSTVAERSVGIAHNGAQVVQRSIDGMNTIREQIQETSKRIKRLGESSQEIGDIVGLINDIADQTNVLALNAAIQASMAGEAGWGFAVVADEVQRLAERSANATKQIETLVRTIQADTNEAVRSMESTTTEVVQGARLAADAGEALKEVQTVSNNLANLIQKISNEAQTQASSASQISKTMEAIEEVTSKTTSGTRATARSVGQLNEMAAALQKSVSGFTLEKDNAPLFKDK